MDIVAGAVTSLLQKLGELLVGEYKLQKGLKGEIWFIQTELESMKGALEKISSTPREQLDNQDKIWARDVRELSYDIEDGIDTFIVQSRGSELAWPQGFKMFIERCYNLLADFQGRRSTAYEIKGIKRRIIEMSERRERYRIDTAVARRVTVDPRLFSQYKNVTELVGIDEARDEVIRMLMEGNEGSKQQQKIVSIVGFGGLGKTTLANVVYRDLRSQFDCSAFVSVSQNPDMDRIFKDMFYQLAKYNNASVNAIEELREFLEKKRFLIVVDDIWDIPIWRMIKCAFPENNVRCKIITTTRILSVAEQAGDAYKLKPLSLENSRKLFYGRIFGNENIDKNEDTEKCPDEDLAEVSDKIMKKCAGIPLAIITISSLLASTGRNKMQWYEVYNSVGTGMEQSLDAENMRKILSYSYYDLPCYLRTCLLYLSIFPEDFKIEKDRLIWLWIAEGFIQRKEQGKSPLDLGESYFNELINRSMIQPMYDDYYDIEIIGCHVHDMVLDLLRCLSSEENFVTILSDMDQTSTPYTVRRLSIQHGNIDYGSSRGPTCTQHIRSVIVFPSGVDQMLALRSFRVLRVLDLEDCYFPEGYNLKYLGNLFHLRYLSLRNTFIDQLPEEIGNLQHLEILDLRGNPPNFCLPLTVAQLKHLMCLCLRWRVPNVIGSLRSLEKLSCLFIDEESRDNVEALGFLTELRVLHVVMFSNKWYDKLVESLGKLRKIQYLVLSTKLDRLHNMDGLDSWVVPRHLRRLETRCLCWFSRLPAWMDNNSSHLLLDLSILSIAVRELRQEDLRTLGTLPSLRYLDLEVDHLNLGIVERFIVGAGSFPGLLRCKLDGFVAPMMFQQAAMPRVTRLDFEFHVGEARKIAARDGCFDLGVGNLLSLQEIKIWFRSEGASEEEVTETKASLMKSVEIHPNRPILELYG